MKLPFPSFSSERWTCIAVTLKSLRLPEATKSELPSRMPPIARRPRVLAHSNLVSWGVNNLALSRRLLGAREWVVMQAPGYLHNDGPEARDDFAWFSGLLISQLRTNVAASPKTAMTCH